MQTTAYQFGGAWRWRRNLNKSMLVRALIMLLLTMPCLQGKGQNRPTAATDSAAKLTGHVTNEQGELLEGVSVTLVNSKGAKTVASTNKKGNYSLSYTGKAILVTFSYVGYESREMVPDNAAANVVLKQKFAEIDDVIVVGYGTKKKKDLTGSVDIVSVEEVRKAPVRSLDEALAGRSAGVQVNSSDGQPGAGSNIVIRGANSVTQSSAPLYVIDGFPIEGFNLNHISTSEIESISILKDASATAIYGARAANGVIVITTKKGKTGDAVITFSSYHNVSSNNKRTELMSPYEFVKYNIDRNPVQGPNSFYYYMVDYKGLTADNYEDHYKSLTGADWQTPFFQTGYQQNYDLAIRGGAGKTTYSISGNINKQTGTILNTGYNRYQGRIILDHTVNSKLKAGVNASYSSTLRYGQSASQGLGGGGGSYILYNVWGYSPIDSLNEHEPIQDVTAALNGINDYRFNPILHQKNAVSNNKSANFNLNSYLEYALLPDVKLRVTGIINTTDDVSETFNNSLTQYGSNVGWNAANGVNGGITWYKYVNWANENTITWRKAIKGGHHLTVLGGFTTQSSKSQAYGFSARLLPNEKLGLSGLDEGTINLNPVAESSIWKYASFLSRVSYAYFDKYLVDLSYRADGTSKFGADNRWGFFPAVGAAWRFKKEKLFEASKLLSDGKLRLSYGQTGSNRGSDFPFVSRFELPGNVGYSFNNSSTRILFVGQNLWGDIAMANQNLKWETTTQYNVGLDLSFWKNRINIVADWYNKVTTDLILNANLPQYSGYTKSLLNVGSVRNSGIEFTLNTTNIDKRSFQWTSSFNIAFNRNKLLSLADGQETLMSAINWDFPYSSVPGYVAKVGEPLGLMYGWIWDGNYQYDDFTVNNEGGYVLKDNVTTNGNVRRNIRPGDIKYRDLNGDKEVNDRDRTVIGNSIPIHIGGFTNNFRYRNFDLGIFCQWSYGNDIQNNNRFVFEGNALGKQAFQQFASYADRWSPTNQDSRNYRAGSSGGGFYGTGYSSRTIEDGSYLRLKTVSLGYNIPAAVLNRIKVKSIRISLSAQNLYTWTKYSGLDPEVSTYNNVLTGGFDYSAYPRARVLAIGADVTF